MNFSRATKETRINPLYKKLREMRVIKRIYLERLGEPLIYNFFSIIVFLFGGIIRKIEYDLVPRQPYAFGLNDAFRNAVSEGCKEIIIVEFGVAAGAGIFNLAAIARDLSVTYKVKYKIFGFDSGKGMPRPLDYRDHPEKYFTGDFPAGNLSLEKLPANVNIIYGDISEKVEELKEYLSSDCRLAFVSVDVDYYSSAVDCLELFIKWNESFYLSKIVCYFDDVNNIDHNEYCGELLAIKEFNLGDYPRRISKMTQLRNWRIFKNALWLDQMYYAHIFDHPKRSPIQKSRQIVELSNPYLD